MKTSTKIIIPIALLFLAGCAHHGGAYSGYYSGYSDSAAYGVSVGDYAPYPVYYDRRPVVVHQHRPVYKERYRPYYKKSQRHRDFKHYSRPQQWRKSDRRRGDHYAGRENRDRYYPGRQYSKNRFDNRGDSRTDRRRGNDRDGRRRSNDYSRNR